MPALSAGWRRCTIAWRTWRGDADKGEQAVRQRQDMAFAFVRKNQNVLGLAMLLELGQAGGGTEVQNSIVDCWRRFGAVWDMPYWARRQEAKAFSGAGDDASACDIYERACSQAIDFGLLPPVDGEVYEAFTRCGLSGELTGRQRWEKLIRKAAAVFQRSSASAVVVLARQCYQAGDNALGAEMLDRAMAAATQERQFFVKLAAVRCLCEHEGFARADEILTEMLKEKSNAGISWLWRLDWSVALRMGNFAKAVENLQRAIDLDYPADLKEIDLVKMRDDYRMLLESYRQLASALTAAGQDAPPGLVAGVIRHADRWRAIDTDQTEACSLAAVTLEKLGRHELAWEYLTTPMAFHPDQTDCWVELAQTLQQQSLLGEPDRSCLRLGVSGGAWQRGNPVGTRRDARPERTAGPGPSASAGRLFSPVGTRNTPR